MEGCIMANCPKCGKPASGSRCPYCGKSLKKSSGGRKMSFGRSFDTDSDDIFDDDDDDGDRSGGSTSESDGSSYESSDPGD
jgi:hypothetical protein